MRNAVTNLYALALVLSVAACGGSTERQEESSETSAASTGGSSEGEGGGPASPSTSSQGGGPTSGTTGTSGTGAAPVDCFEGAPPGAACANEGEYCSNPGTSCWTTCTDGIWLEDCTDCPADPPQDGTDCSDYYQVGPCSYSSDCGDVSATCDGPTGLWEVDETDCG